MNTSKVGLDFEKVEYARGKAKEIANQVQDFVENYTTVAVERTLCRLLGIDGSREFRLEFKWADNMQEEGNIADFLVNGDVAPLGRFNYVLKGKP